ncbi:MAG: TraB/GumN family protein [Betaproteobacteria bacterium]
MKRLSAATIGVVLLAALSMPAAPAEPFAAGRLWRVAKPGIADSYVFGTIHIADPRVSTVSAPVESALARSRTLATELTVDAAAAARGVDLEEAADGQRLEPLLGEADLALLRALLLAQDIPERSIERMKPWAAMLKSTRAAPGSGGASLDEQLFSIARARKMRVAPLEFVEEQVAAFDAIPLATQVALLKHTLAWREELPGDTESTIAAWLRGDLAALARICQGTCARSAGMREHYAALTRHIVHDRTALLHHRLFVPLREGRVFVAIGAMHLYGGQGLLAMLKKDGYRVTRQW